MLVSAGDLVSVLQTACVWPLAISGFLISSVALFPRSGQVVLSGRLNNDEIKTREISLGERDLSDGTATRQFHENEAVKWQQKVSKSDEDIVIEHAERPRQNQVRALSSLTATR
jgi:hypothetical protein